MPTQRMAPCRAPALGHGVASTLQQGPTRLGNAMLHSARQNHPATLARQAAGRNASTSGRHSLPMVSAPTALGAHHGGFILGVARGRCALPLRLARGKARGRLCAVSTHASPPAPQEDRSGNNTNIIVNAALLTSVAAMVLNKEILFESQRWRGWTLGERLSHFPTDLWDFYNDSLVAYPLLVPAVVTGITYCLADWISQTYEGRMALDFDRPRLFRAGAIGFVLLGPLAHYYYTLQDIAFATLFPQLLTASEPPWWNVPAHIAVDQTGYAALYNAVFYMAVGVARGEREVSEVWGEFTSNFWRLMKAGWRLWPFVHIITYGVIPPQHKVLWVDAVEIVWATILCLVVNEKRDASVEQLEQLEGSPVQAAVIEKLESFVTEVREEQWEDELLPEDQKKMSVFKSEQSKATLSEAAQVEDLARKEVEYVIQAEMMALDERLMAVEAPFNVETNVEGLGLVAERQLQEHAPALSELDPEGRVAMADVLEAMVEEAKEDKAIRDAEAAVAAEAERPLFESDPDILPEVVLAEQMAEQAVGEEAKTR